MIGVLSTLVHSSTNEVGIGTSSHDLVLEDTRIFSTPSSDTGMKEDKVFSIGLDLMHGMGDDCKPDTILKNFLTEKNVHISDRSTKIV